MNILAVLLGGGVGSLARYTLGLFIARSNPGAFPWPTLTVNLVGAFVAGFLYESFVRHPVDPHLRVFLFVGLLGGFTTFSSFGLETANLLRGEHLWDALTYLLVTNVVGVPLVFLGLFAARCILKAMGR